VTQAATSVTPSVRPGATRVAVRLVGVRKNYGRVMAADGVDLEIADGEFFTMLGPSGSGKTTLLRIIAGFERPDSGTVELRGTDVTRQPPYMRDVNTVFQDYALFPHMTVVENVEYGLKIRKVAKAERRRRANQMLDMVRLSGLGGRKPLQLSGDSVSAWPWPGPSSTNRGCSCSTSRSGRST
jgi:putative spermidine/putrescine transport system ATP-binding protein